MLTCVNSSRGVLPYYNRTAPPSPCSTHAPTVPQLPCAPPNTQDTRPIDNDLQLKARVNFDDIFSENWTLIFNEQLLDVYFSNMIN